MAAKSARIIYVYTHWSGSQQPALMGRLHVEHLRGKEIFSFEYDKAWLDSGHDEEIDPELQLYPGPQYLKEERKNFGIFLDSSPDRWGRLLMRRREAAMARAKERPQQTLFETDYLLGVYDEQRMGAIRFKESADGPFLSDNKRLASPPWSSVRELTNASLQLERDDIADDPEYMKWLNMLIAPGSSLGGARPKASIVDEKGHLWIAKFPSRNDEKDIGAWEMVVYDLAILCGINMAKAKLEKYSGRQHTFMTKRFDRTDTGERIHFASAMTLLGYNDGTDHNDGASYLELAEFLTRRGADTDNDLEELWRRIVFNICVSNTDDHLRNHGFLLTSRGWRLSPAFDINPNETGEGLKLNISEHDNALDLNLALEVAAYFRVSKAKAAQITTGVKAATGKWRHYAEKYKIPKSEQDMMERAFRER